MANHTIKKGASKTERVILQLFGIDKKWVLYDGLWTDMKNLPKPEETQTTNEIAFDEDSPKQWWQFWKKSI